MTDLRGFENGQFPTETTRMSHQISVFLRYWNSRAGKSIHWVKKRTANKKCNETWRKEYHKQPTG